MRPRAVVVALLLLLGLAACARGAPAPPSATPAPSATSVPSRTPTATASITPSQTSTATPVPRWREYEIAIAEAIGDPNARCEWKILAQQEAKSFLEVMCRGERGGQRFPSVLAIGQNGEVANVWVPRQTPAQPEEIAAAFGEFNQVWLDTEQQSDPLWNHAYYQNRLQGTPPAVAMTATPQPRWRAYEIAISAAIDDPYARCEWVILGVKGKQVFLKVVCFGNGGRFFPAVLTLGSNGEIETVWVPPLVEEPGKITEALGDLYQAWYDTKLDTESANLQNWLYYQNRRDGTPPAIVLTGTPLP